MMLPYLSNLGVFHPGTFNRLRSTLTSRYSFLNLAGKIVVEIQIYIMTKCVECSNKIGITNTNVHYDNCPFLKGWVGL